jgi:serine/threonine protein kinase
MRAPDGAPKVLDFGLARVEAGSGTTITNLTATGTILGTPAYMSPEQVRGQAVDARSDVFALGVILYELVTGTNPFSGSDTTSTVARILESEPPPLVSRSGAVPPGHREPFVTIETVVRASIHKTASARLPSAAAFVAALEGGRVATAGLGSAAAPAAGGSGAAWRSSGVVAPSSAKAPFWWWQFHQGAVSAAYLALFVPIGFAWPRLTEPFGRLLFFAALVPALAAVLLRLHLWFTARAHPETWSNEHRQSAAWIRRADLAFGAVLASGGFLVAGASVPVAAALLGGAVAVVVASVVIEPATRRAAFGE